MKEKFMDLLVNSHLHYWSNQIEDISKKFDEAQNESNSGGNALLGRLPCGSCAECKFEEFYDKFGSHCNKHNKALNEMFDNLELTLDEIGCKQFEQK